MLICSIKNDALDQLILDGTIKTYEYCNVDENGIPYHVSKFRNTEQVIFHFNNGKSLKISTFCSGSLEDTTLHFAISSPVQPHTDNHEQRHKGDPLA